MKYYVKTCAKNTLKSKMDKKGIKGFIFDYGGTLDTGGRNWGKVLWHVYEDEKMNVAEEHFREAYVYAERVLGTQPIIQSRYTFYKTLKIKVQIELEYLKSKSFLECSDEQIGEYVKLITDNAYAQAKNQLAYSRGILQRIKNDYPLVLVSNFYGNIDVVLKEFNIDNLFEGVIESAVVGIRKPDPRIFSLGVDKLGLKAAEVVVVGDSFKKDIVPAKKIGCKTIWYKGEEWDTVNNDESFPDAVITDLQEILD